MLRNGLVAIATAVIVGLGLVFQVTATDSHEVKDERPPAQTQSPDPPSTSTEGGAEAPAAPGSGERAPGDENGHSGGKPGEAPKG